ncbi:protoporphyrinogen oxidase [Fusarium albosuccineum]|uniref:Protoporphyrinogen oxidase n=1 Tax=Fusarium albosuccineum TaxID=1237068 RepID=A0A8H4KY80_9HYPO|nr:protoporphyrinogen oxidase [Fusarium albosuccineum]
MSSYLITGVSRGLGFEFLRQLSEDPKNTVVGLVRNKKATDEKVQRELSSRTNIHIIQADIVDYDALKVASVAETSKITGGSLDCIIANAGLVSAWSAYDPPSVLGKEPKRLEEDLLECFNINVVGNIHLFNLYMPLVLKGRAKKVITISTGMADLDLITNFSIAIAAPYSISKGAVNVAVAKFDAEYRKDGVLFMSISPGVVDTGHYDNATEEQAKKAAEMGAQFQAYAPNFKGPISPKESATAILSVMNKSSIENGDGGAFVSHLGNKQWL